MLSIDDIKVQVPPDTINTSYIFKYTKISWRSWVGGGEAKKRATWKHPGSPFEKGPRIFFFFLSIEPPNVHPHPLARFHPCSP